MLRDIFRIWKLYCFETMLNEFKNRQERLPGEIFNPNVIQKLKESDFFRQVRDRIIDGTSVENLKVNEDKFRIITMPQEFSNSVKMSYKYAPVIYCLNITKRLLDLENELKIEGRRSEQYWRFLGRAYRSFASFIRDYDSKEKIEDFLNKKKWEEDVDIKISQNPILDSMGHTDILFMYKDKKKTLEFRIWLYQSTKKGLENLIERLRGRRGDLENGYHVFAPIDIYCSNDKVEDKFHWILYSDIYLKNIVRICSEIFNEKYHTFEIYNELIEELDDWSIKRDINLTSRLSDILVFFKKL